MTIPVAFYAPLKSPDDPTPSGDRAMARLIFRALERAGFAPRLASRLRTFDREGRAHPALAETSRAEAARIAEDLGAQRPRLWFTYHVHYKAPDWIGPVVAARLGIPYVVAEGSRAGKRARGPHAFGHAAAEAALDAADAILCLTARDRVALERARPPGQRLLDLPPFLDLDDWPEHPRTSSAGPARLLAVGMMRPGDKLASYRLLAAALGTLPRADWNLTIAGDGPERETVAAIFAPFGDRVAHAGLLGREALGALYAAGDLLVWPAVNEAYGLALLEAGAQGCPVVAGGYGGVPEVVRDGETGLVTAPGDPVALAGAVAALLADPARRRALGRAARDHVRGARGLDAAAARLGAALGPLIRDA